MSRHLIIDRGDLEAWAGRVLTDAEVERIAARVPHSSIPDAIGVIASEAIVRYRWNDHTNDIGDWCPHSEEPVTPDSEPDSDAGDDTARCPAGCRASRPTAVGDDGDGDGDGVECEECEQLIPRVEGGALANRHHATSCSLYDKNKD